MNDQPDPRASLRGLMALVLDMARADPDRRPSHEMQRWHRDLAATMSVEPAPTPTNRELLDAVLRLERIAQTGAPPPHEAAAEASRSTGRPLSERGEAS